MATLKDLKEAVSKAKTEQGALSLVVRAFAAAGHRGQPTAETARDPQAGTVRIYRWKASPVGDCVLIGGPSIVPELHLTSEIAESASGADFAVPAVPTQLAGKAAALVDHAIQRGARSPAAAQAAEVVKEKAPREAAPRVRRAPPAPPPVMVEEAVYEAPAPVYAAPESDDEVGARVMKALRQVMRGG